MSYCIFRGDAGGASEGSLHGRDIHGARQLDDLPDRTVHEADGPHNGHDNGDFPSAAGSRDFQSLRQHHPSLGGTNRVTRPPGECPRVLRECWLQVPREEKS